MPFDEDELPAHVPKEFGEYAQCSAGYSNPAAKISWTNTVSQSVTKCDLGIDNMSGCEIDTDESGFL